MVSEFNLKCSEVKRGAGFPQKKGSKAEKHMKPQGWLLSRPRPPGQPQLWGPRQLWLLMGDHCHLALTGVNSKTWRRRESRGRLRRGTQTAPVAGKHAAFPPTTLTHGRGAVAHRQ